MPQSWKGAEKARAFLLLIGEAITDDVDAWEIERVIRADGARVMRATWDGVEFQVIVGPPEAT